MREAFIIKYEYPASDGLDLTSLGESFVGFDAVLKDILEIAQLGEVVEVKATRVQEGSIILYNALVSLSPVLFDSVPVFLEFLKIAAPELIKDANTFFSVAVDTHRTVNDYFARNPVDFELNLLIVAFIFRSLHMAGKLKKNGNASLANNLASPRQINRLTRMIQGGRYRRALLPVTEGNVSKIDFIPLQTTKVRNVAITEENVGDYLPDESQILPELTNGMVVKFTGELVTLQSMKGDTVKIRVDGLDPSHCLLVGTAADGSDIEDYAQYFKHQVVVEAEIHRKTMYRRPDLIIKRMALSQEELALSDGLDED